MRYQSKFIQYLSECKPNYSLPQGLYLSDAAFQSDMENLFLKEWLFVAHECELPEAGDYLRYQIDRCDVIIVKSDNGKINAFHNSCRHRGSRLCNQEKGSNGQFVCPYHQWTYDLEGRLRYAKDMQSNFDPSQHHLHGVHCETMAGNIYICLGDDAPDFESFRKTVEPYLLPHNLKDAKVAHESTIVEEGNWKLVIENNRECYHCLGSHPELCRTYSDDPTITGIPDDGSDAPQLVQDHWEKCESLGLPSAFKMSESGQYRVARMPLTGDSTSFTMDGGSAVSKPLTSVNEEQLGTLLLFHYPNTWNHFLSDHAVTFRVTPLGPERTQVTTKWLVHKDAVEGKDYQLDALTAVWEATNDQDRQLVEENHRGVASQKYSPGPYSLEHEGGVVQFIEWYLNQSTNRLDADYAGAEYTPDELEKPFARSEQQTQSNTSETTKPQEPTALEQQKQISQKRKPALSNIDFQAPPDPEKVPFLYIDESQPWQDQSELLELVNIIPETIDVTTYSFRTSSNNWFSFAPGQFITLELPINNELVYRTYTISSSPSRPLSLSVTVKTSPDSIGSRWMSENLRIGMKLRAFGPIGEFNLYKHPADKYCFISAGSGITPMMSMTKYLFDRGGDIDISFIHCARSPSNIIARDEIERLSERVPGIKPYWIVNERDPFSAWAGIVGAMNQLILELTTPDFYEREIFCCGPKGFMQTVRDILNATNFNMEHYHEESFEAPILEADEIEHNDVVLDQSIATKVTFLNSGESVESNQTTTLLETSLQAGLNIPSACKFGVCGTCKIKKVSGETHMVHNGGITQKETEQGYVLACCSNPLTDVELEY